MSYAENAMITRLTYGDKEIMLVGTAHVSHESAELVREIIKTEKPDTVCVELCPSRYQSITQKDSWRNTDIVKIIREKKSFVLLANLLLSSFQRRVASKLDIQPGQEVLNAIEAAKEEGAEIVTVDRDIRVTLSRAWRLIGFWDKMKLLTELVFSFGSVDDISEEEIESMKNEDMLETILKEVGKSQPKLKKVLIDERDLYLAESIRKAPGKRIIAVVGAGHTPGIKAHFNDESIDVAELTTLPPKGKAGVIVKWGIPVVIVLIIIIGFFFGGSKVGADMIVWWFIINAAGAFIGALAALSHPLTILTAAVAAPFTSLNPTIAAGWVAGLVEAALRKPKVADLENLYNDIMSFKGFWRNKVTRLLLVVVLTNLGSAVGTIVFFPVMLKYIVA